MATRTVRISGTLEVNELLPLSEIAREIHRGIRHAFANAPSKIELRERDGGVIRVMTRTFNADLISSGLRVFFSPPVPPAPRPTKRPIRRSALPAAMPNRKP